MQDRRRRSRQLSGVSKLARSVVRQNVEPVGLGQEQVDVAAELTLVFQASDDPPTVIARPYSFQKVYLVSEAGASELFDVQTALI